VKRIDDRVTWLKL